MNCPSFCIPNISDKCDNCTHAIDFECNNCEDSGYEWESDVHCKKCDKGRQAQHESNIQSLKYCNKRVRELRALIKDYKMKL